MDEKTRLLELVRQTAKLRFLSRKTVNAYSNHIRRFLEFNGKSDLSKIEADEIRAFFKYLDADAHFAAATQNQALCALTFLYRDVFGQELAPYFKSFRRARQTGAPPTVFTSEEAKTVLANLTKAPFLVAALMYGAGLRLREALSLRVGDIAAERREITVRDLSTGAKNHTTILPDSIVPALRRHLTEVRFLHEDDCLSGCGAVFLPFALRQKYAGAEYEWRWQYVFPACKLAANGDGTFQRHHLAESTVQKAVSAATAKARIFKKVCCHTFRYSFAVRLYEKNHDVHTIRNLLGHKNLKTTMNYLGSFKNREKNVRSPLDY